MIIDFSKIEEVPTPHLKGGEGTALVRKHEDAMGRIMMIRLQKGVTIGYHRHEDSCEIIRIVSGQARCFYEDTVEELKPGDVHYCPEGRSHSMTNPYDEDLIFFAIVPEKK